MMNKPYSPEDVIPSPKLRALLSRRNTRRLLVVTGNLTFLAMIFTFVNVERLGVWVWPVCVLLALLVCIHGVLLNVGSQLIAASREQHLDERQRSVWDRAHRTAYRILVASVSLMILYGFLAYAVSWWLPEDFLSLWALALAFWGLMVTLPSDVVYWTEPDAPESP